MLITCHTTFLDGRLRYVKGETREVDDSDAARFIAAGWAAPIGEAPGPQSSGETQLEVHSADQTVKDNHG